MQAHKTVKCHTHVHKCEQTHTCPQHSYLKLFRKFWRSLESSSLPFRCPVCIVLVQRTQHNLSLLTHSLSHVHTHLQAKVGPSISDLLLLGLDQPHVARKRAGQTLCFLSQCTNLHQGKLSRETNNKMVTTRESPCPQVQRGLSLIHHVFAARPALRPGPGHSHQ